MSMIKGMLIIIIIIIMTTITLCNGYATYMVINTLASDTLGRARLIILFNYYSILFRRRGSRSTAKEVDQTEWGWSIQVAAPDINHL